MQHIGNRIKALIDNSKYSAKEIAEKMGTSFQNVYRICDRESVETKHLYKIADALGIPITQFFEESSVLDLSSELQALKSEIIVKDTAISHLQNQVELLEKLVKTHETIIQKTDTISSFADIFMYKQIPPPSINKNKLFSELAKSSGDIPALFKLLIRLNLDAEMTKAFKDFLEFYEGRKN